MAESTPASRLRQARTAAGFKSASDAARNFGVKPVTYTAHENGGREYGREECLYYAKKFKVAPEWLMFGIEPAPLIPGSHPAHKRILDINTRNMRNESRVNPLIDDDGTLDPDCVKYWIMPDDFIVGRLRLDPEHTWIMDYQGDAMYNPSDPNAAGSIMPGDRVIIDMVDRTPSPAGPFAIDDGTGIILKMLEVIPTSKPTRVRVTCRNPQYQSYEQDMAQISVIGRVRGKVCEL